jgi:hypothetical protein
VRTQESEGQGGGQGCRIGGKAHFGCYFFIAEFYFVDRGLRHRLPGFSSFGRLVILP